MIKCNLLKFSFIGYFRNELKYCLEFNLPDFGTGRYYCVMKISKMFGFLPQINNLLTFSSVFFDCNYVIE